MNARASRPRFDVLAVLMLGGFINFLTIFELTPLLPGIARDFAVSAALGGQLATVTALAAFAGSLLATPFMDRVGRRAWLWAEAGLLAAGWLASVAAPGFGWLMAGRALSGLGLAVLMANVYAVTLSLLFMASGVVELGSDSALPAMIRRAGAPRVVAAGALVCAAALVLAGTAFASVRAAFVMAAMMNIGTSAVIIGVNARLLATPTAAPGAVMSLAAAANGLGNWIGPLLTGSLLAATGEYPAAYRLLGLAPLICIVCVGLAGPARSRAARPARQPAA